MLIDLDMGVVSEVVEKSGMMKAEKKLSKWVAYPLVYDVIIGDGVKCGGVLKTIAHRHTVR